MAEATSQGAKVIWVGMPPDAEPRASRAGWQILNGMVQAAARHSPGVAYVGRLDPHRHPDRSVHPVSGGEGQEVNVREPDGTHIAPGGAQVLSEPSRTMRNALHIVL